MNIGTTMKIIISTLTIVVSVLGSYFGLKSDIKELATRQDTQNQINNLRFSILEDKERDDHEWLKTMSRRVLVIEQRTGVITPEKQTDK